MTTRWVRVGGRLVRLEQPAAAPAYDIFHVMGAGVAGFLAGLIMLSGLVLHR